MSTAVLENYFKPEVRNAGRAFVTKERVSVQQPSDTEIVSYIRAATSIKVSLKTPDVGSDLIQADCSCPLAKKGQLCKHIWAAVLKTEDDRPDFLEGKTSIDKVAVTSAKSKAPPSAAQQEAQSKYEERQAAFKEKQADYRKLNYQKQKLRLNKMKQAKNNKAPENDDYPPVIEAALKYFSENGFELRDDMTKESVSFAMKKLAQIFHPDKGGTHEEITELNRQAEVLSKFSPK